MEQRVSKLETEVINLDKRLSANERRLDIHGEEIDGINKVVGNLEKNMALLNLTVDNVLENTKEIKGDIKEIKLTRNGVIKKYNNDKKLVRKQELNI